MLDSDVSEITSDLGPKQSSGGGDKDEMSLLVLTSLFLVHLAIIIIIMITSQ